jgi:ribosomal protein S6
MNYFPLTQHIAENLYLHYSYIIPDYNALTKLMKEISLKIVNNGGIVRSIQNHGIRQLPHRFKAKYADAQGDRYYEKGRFISVFYDANPTVMKQVHNILSLDDQILRTTHLRASNKFGEVNNLKLNKNPYIQKVLEEMGLKSNKK